MNNMNPAPTEQHEKDIVGLLISYMREKGFNETAHTYMITSPLFASFD
jgi:hypothetical protein